MRRIKGVAANRFREMSPSLQAAKRRLTLKACRQPLDRLTSLKYST